MSQLTTIDTNNYAAMAEAMGIANEKQTGLFSRSLARLRITSLPQLWGQPTSTVRKLMLRL
jgi:hypothetical protein